MANWSDLPLDILTLLAKRLPCAEEFVRFGGVCKSWRDAANDVKKGRRFNPWMMLSKSENDDARGGVRTLYDLSSGKFYNIRLPQLQGRKCWGTQYGWLISLGIIDKDIFLFHPLTQATLYLPSQLNLGSNSDPIVKFAISSDPSHQSSPSPTVMASFGSSSIPAFASIGDQTWTTMPHPYSNVDIIFFEGHFYTINPIGKLSIISINASSVPHTMVIAPPPGPKNSDELGKFYLVEVCASLYLINRCYEDPDSDDEDILWGKLKKTTQCFNAYKLNFKKKKWIFRQHLQGYALFLGNNQSFAISPLDYPHFKSNYIYYTDDFDAVRETDYLDMGIYDYVNNTITKPFDNCARLPSSKLSGQVFFMPQLS